MELKTQILFLISNVKLVFCSKRDHHFLTFEGLIRVSVSNHLDTVQVKVTPHFHPLQPSAKFSCFVLYFEYKSFYVVTPDRKTRKLIIMQL
jgi:hypothetical protein